MQPLTSPNGPETPWFAADASARSSNRSAAIAKDIGGRTAAWPAAGLLLLFAFFTGLLTMRMMLHVLLVATLILAFIFRLW